MPADVGLISGLAQDFGGEERIADLRYQNQMKRQAQIASENKAKMLADDFQFSNAMNAWDNQNVKQYAQGKIKEIGTWIRQNPDYLYNVEKRGLYNNMVHELKDNQHLNTGMQVDANIKSYQDWMAKNPELRELPESAQIKNELANYLKTGSTDGISTNRKIFQFEAPTKYDFNSLLEQYGKKIPKTLKGKSVIANGLLQLQYGSTDTDIRNQAKAMLTGFTPYQAKQWEADYKSNLAQNKKSPDKYSMEDYAKDVLSGHVTQDDFQHASYHVNDKAAGDGNANGKQKPFTTADSLFSKVLAQTYGKNAGHYIPFNSASAANLISDKDNNVNTNEGKIFIRDDHGNLKDIKGFNGGTTKGLLAGSKIISMPVQDPETKKIVYATYVTGKVRMPYQQFNQAFGEEATGDQDWFGTNIQFNDKYKGIPANIVENKDGKSQDVEVELSFPIKADDPQTHYLSDQGAGTKPLQYGFGGDEKQPQVIDTKVYHGKKYFKLDNGDVVDEQGNKY